MTDLATPEATTEHRLAELRSATTASRQAFGALIARDLRVLRKTWKIFIPRTIMQPLLLMFVFTYVFPKIGQGVGGGGNQDRFATLLVAGVVGLTIIMQGIQAVAMPLVTEFGYSREVEDRVLAPLPVAMVAIGKITTGAIQGLIAAVFVWPIAYFVPASNLSIHVHWLLLITIIPLACWVSGALGLVMGTAVEPMQVPILWGIVIMPMMMLGATYYPWASLGPIKWLKIAVLINPLLYMAEGARASLTHGVAHMPLWGIYLGLFAAAAGFTWIGIKGFTKRVIS